MPTKSVVLVLLIDPVIVCSHVGESLGDVFEDRLVAFGDILRSHDLDLDIEIARRSFGGLDALALETKALATG